MQLSHRTRLAATLCAAVAVLVTPALLFAHAHLVRSSPAANGRLDSSPTALSLWFSERPEVRFTELQLLDSAGVAASLGAIAPVAGDTMGVTAPIAASLANGRYTVVWRTAAADGHPTNGRFTFVVAATPATTPAVSAPDTNRVPPPVETQRQANSPVDESQAATFSTAERWAELVAVLMLIGAMVFRLFVIRDAGLAPALTSDAGDRARRLASAVLALFVVATLWRLSAESNLVPGVTGRIDAMTSVVRGTAWGRGWLIGAFGAVTTAVGLFVARRSHAGWIVATLGVIAICFGEGLTGHAGVLRQRGSLALAIDLAHLLGAGGWLGGLAAVLLCGFPAMGTMTGAEKARAGRVLVRSYHRAAVECVAIVLVTAVLGAWVRFAALSELWTTMYGRILLLKLGLAVVALGFGFFHWRSAVIPEWDEDTGFRFRRSAAFELLVGAAIVGVTALLVSTSLPST